MGAGGTGGYLGGLLLRAGEDVAFVARGAHLDAMRRKGLTIRLADGGEFRLNVRATDNPHDLPKQADLVLFCVKTYDVDAAAELIRPAVGDRTVVLPIQNGIETVDRLVHAFGASRVLGGLAYMSAVVEEPGVIRQKSPSVSVVLGEHQGGSSPRVQAIRDAFRRSGIHADAPPDVRVALWEKFLFICGVNGVTAVTRLPLGKIFGTPETAEWLKGVMSEVARVAEAKDVPLPSGPVENALATARSMGPDVRGSMYYDLVAGRRLELEALHGSVVRQGKDAGVPTPLNFSIYAALLPYSNGQPT